MNAEIITVGTELLLGDIVNSNSQFLSRELAAYGISMWYQSTVGDNPARLREVLTLAFGRSELVIVTGGLGPTPDDLTRETVCEALGIPLVLHEESWQRIQEYFISIGREMTDNNRKQAMLPANCTVFPNDHGTAPGCAVEQEGRCILLLPGPPHELIPMFQDYVSPFLSRFSGGTIFSRTVHVFGLPEATVAGRIGHLLELSNPTVAPYAKEGEVTLRVTAYASDIDAAADLCAPVVEELKALLGIYVYGVDVGSLQKRVVSLLAQKHMKIATAESCTAGMLSGRLTEVSGASHVFECGIAAYSKEIKHNMLGVSDTLLATDGAVSPAVARAMAVGARSVGQAHLGIGITGEAGPLSSEGKPVGTVYIALADKTRSWIKELTPGSHAEDREYVRHLATSHALDLTRRYLEALPGVMAGGTLFAPALSPKEIPIAPKTGSKRRFLATLFPWKGDTLRERIGKCTAWLAILALLAGMLFVVYSRVWEPSNNKRINDSLVNIYNNLSLSNMSGSADYPAGMLSRFFTLYSHNQDIGGWVKIDDTGINYPVMKNAGNGYYAQHNFMQQYSAYGVPYFHSDTALVSPKSINRTMTIYGNNPRNGQMFSDLLQYRNLEFFRAHPTVEMNTIFSSAKWKVFSVFYLDADAGKFSFPRATFTDDADFMQFVHQLKSRSLFVVPAEVTAEDSLLFLVSDAEEEMQRSGGQFVVAARRLRAGEIPLDNMGDAALNVNVPTASSLTAVRSTQKPPAKGNSAPTLTVSRTQTQTATTTTAATTPASASTSTAATMTSTKKSAQPSKASTTTAYADDGKNDESLPTSHD